MKIYRLAQADEYMLEGGILYDADAEDVFNVKELLHYNVPLFKTPQEANAFLEQIEKTTGKKLGRVSERNLMKEIRYKDTRKERQEADMEFLDERNKRWQKGDF